MHYSHRRYESRGVPSTGWTGVHPDFTIASHSLPSDLSGQKNVFLRFRFRSGSIGDGFAVNKINIVFDPPLSPRNSPVTRFGASFSHSFLSPSGYLPTTATSNLTMSCWVTWQGAAFTFPQFIMYNGEWGINGYGIGLPNTATVYVGSSTPTTYNLVVNQPTFLTLEIASNNSLSLYVNGTLEWSSSSSGFPTPTNNIVIGGSSTSTSFNGVITSAQVRSKKSCNFQPF